MWKSRTCITLSIALARSQIVAAPTRSPLLSHWEIVIAGREEGRGKRERSRWRRLSSAGWICLTNGFIMSFIHLSHRLRGIRPSVRPSVPPVPALNNSQSSLIGGASDDRDIVTGGRADVDVRFRSVGRSLCVFAKKETRTAELTRPPLVAHTLSPRSFQI